MHLPQNKIIELRNVGITYSNGFSPFQDINFAINEGDFIAITGPNGGGKTTLLRLILQLIKPSTGAITYQWKGKEVDHLNFGYLPQKNAIDTHFPITVKEVIASGLQSMNKWFHHKSKEDERLVAETLQLVGLENRKDFGIGQLSGGQMQRALLGRAIISKPDVLVLDEPLSYVDKDFETPMYKIIADLAKTTTVIIVSHEMTAISQMATRHIIIDGTLHECHAEHHYVAPKCR